MQMKNLFFSPGSVFLPGIVRNSSGYPSGSGRFAGPPSPGPALRGMAGKSCRAITAKKKAEGTSVIPSARNERVHQRTGSRCQDI